MKTIAPSLKKQKNKLHITAPWVYLFIVQVSATDAMYITNHSESIGYDGHTYKPFPVEVGEITEDSKGNLESVTLSISNVNRMVMAYMEQHDALQGKDVWMFIVNRVDPTQCINLGVYQIVEASADSNVATFVLGHYNFFALKFPRNRYIRGRCRWVYKSTECGYVGGLATCDKTLGETDGCRVHNNEQRFGGFPSIPSGKRLAW